MNKTLSTVDWNLLRAFYTTANLGSLTAAAKALSLTQPTLSRQIDTLEKTLAITLFERVGRGLALTNAGRDLLQTLGPMAEAAQHFSLVAAGQLESIDARVSVTVTEGFAVYHLPPVLKQLKRIAPSIKIDIVATSESSDLKRREADIAIRAYRPNENDLIVKRLCEYQGSLYATPEFLASIGKPNTVDAFDYRHFLGFSINDDCYPAYLNDLGINVDGDDFAMSCESYLVNWELVKQGFGIGPNEINAGDAEPKVERILPNYIAFTGELWLVSHRELRTNKANRIVFDYLAEHFRD